MFLDKSTHPTPKLGDSLNQLSGSQLPGRVPACWWTGDADALSRQRPPPGLPLLAKSSARNLAGNRCVSWSISPGKTLGTNKFPLLHKQGNRGPQMGRAPRTAKLELSLVFWLAHPGLPEGLQPDGRSLCRAGCVGQGWGAG